jgi:hypothetical protein
MARTKVFGGKAGELGVEGQQYDGVDAGGGEQL